MTIDEDGYVTLPSVGRLKAAGLTPSELSSSVIPRAAEHNRDVQSPRIDLNWSIEKITPRSAAIDEEKVPTTQHAGALAYDEPVRGQQPAATIGPTTAPTTSTLRTHDDAGQMLPPVFSGGDQRIDVVVIVQSADASENVPASMSPSIEPSSGTPLESPVEPAAPATQPAGSTQPTTAPQPQPEQGRAA